jgi:hypothetical protein
VASLKKASRSWQSYATGLTCLVLATSGCGGCERSLNSETHVDVPVTLAEIKKLYHPPDVVVQVQRQEATSGGGACGHSPVCAILIPILVFDALFPKKWDEVSVTKSGKPSYVARFETNGDFIESTQYQPAKARYFASLLLKQLGRRVIVQIGESTLAPDGGQGQMVHTPILPQVNLLPDYEAALAKEKDDDDRAALIVEATTWLGDESLAFLDKHAKDEKESDQTRARVVSGACATADKRRDTALSAAHRKPGPRTISQALKCSTEQHLDAELAFFVAAAADRACQSKTSSELSELAEAIPAEHPQLAEAAGRCSQPSVRTLLLVRAGKKLPGPELAAAMRDPGPYAGVLEAWLSPSRPEERAALFAGLGAHPELERIVKALAEAELTPSSDELRPLVTSYAYDAPLFDGPRQVQILGLFQRASAAQVESSDARRDLEAVISRTKDGDRPLLRAAQMVLGDRAQAAAASRGLGERSHEMHISTTAASEIIGRAFLLAGCKPDEIKAAYRGASKLSDSDRGVLCTKSP